MELEFPMIFGVYSIEIGKSETDASIKCDVYKLRNMQTGLVEAETSSLPRAIISANASNHTLKKLLEKTPTESEVISAERDLDILEGETPPDGIPH